MERSVLNTKEIREIVDANQIRALRADWSTGDEAIGELMLKLQGSQQIPLLAIFPGDRPNQPIVLKTFYSQAKLIEKLEQAGPSAVAASSQGHQSTLRSSAESNADEIANAMP